MELAGAVLAESAAPVMVFETGLPARYYVDRDESELRTARARAKRKPSGPIRAARLKLRKIPPQVDASRRDCFIAAPSATTAAALFRD